MAAEDVALRKRQQITKANRTMFIWIAAASVVVGVAIVLSIFLFQKLVFNQRVIATKQSTVSTLVANVQTLPKLQDNVRVLNSNQALLQNRANEDDTALQVILDALPSSPNGSALGASLQSVLLLIDGVSVESLTVASTESGDSDTGANTIPFTFTVSAASSQSDKLLQLLQRLEQSIRAIDVQDVSVEMGSGKIRMSVKATASYEPAVTIDLKTETMQP